MPQSPIAVAAGKTPTNTLIALATDAAGRLLVGAPGAGQSTALNVNAARVVKAAPGTLVSVNVIVAGAAGTANDCLTTGAAAVGNQIGTLPAVVGNYVFNAPCAVGIVIVPGAGQTVSVVYN